MSERYVGWRCGRCDEPIAGRFSKCPHCGFEGDVGYPPAGPGAKSADAPTPVAQVATERTITIDFAADEDAAGAYAAIETLLHEMGQIGTLSICDASQCVNSRGALIAAIRVARAALTEELKAMISAAVFAKGRHAERARTERLLAALREAGEQAFRAVDAMEDPFMGRDRRIGHYAAIVARLMAQWCREHGEHELAKMERVVVTRPIIGVCHMGVCAAKDCSDQEILAFANRENPAGTTNGWSRVIREDEPPNSLWPIDRLKPMQCADDPARVHLTLVC